MLAFDVSASMAADDLRPTRLEAAKAAARDFVRRQPSTVKIGVVSFSNGGFATQAPTRDPNAVLAAIDRLKLQSGTSLASGIHSSLNAIAVSSGQGPLTLSARPPATTPQPSSVPEGTFTSAVVVLLTDGENNALPDPLSAAEAAANRGVRVFTVGIGSEAGAILRLDGFSVRSRLDAATLRQVAERTGGAYFNAQNEEELRTIYSRLNPRLVLTPQATEVTSLLAGVSILLLVIGGALSLVWFGRLP